MKSGEEGCSFLYNNNVTDNVNCVTRLYSIILAEKYCYNRSDLLFSLVYIWRDSGMAFMVSYSISDFKYRIFNYRNKNRYLFRCCDQMWNSSNYLE